MFYVIETQYIGPDQDQQACRDTHTFEVSTEPARGNSSGEVNLQGWCGTTNDWAVYARGEFASQAEAEAWIKTWLGEDGYREADSDELAATPGESTVARFKVGRYAPMGADGSRAWAYAGIQEDVHHDTTEERMAELIDGYQEACRRDEGAELDEHVLEESMKDRRQALLNEAEA